MIQDLIRHIEYIHYNPVKHGLLTAPGDWEYSSFHQYVHESVYDPERGSGVEIEFEPTIGGE